MTLTSLLHYFADLAPAGRGPDWNRAPAEADFQLLDWTQITPMLPQLEQGRPLRTHGPTRTVPRPLTGDRKSEAARAATEWARLTTAPQPPVAWTVRGGSRAFERLMSIERLHRAEKLLRLGWLFLSGTAKIDDVDTRVFLPLVSAPVTVDRIALRNHRLETDRDFGLPRRVLSDEDRHHLEADLEDLLGRVFMSPRSMQTVDLSHSGRIARWVREVAAVMGLPAPELAPVDRTPFEKHRGLLCYAGMAVYTARNIDAPNVGQALRNWASQPLTETALAALYGQAASYPDRGDEDAEVVSPLPLNDRQTEILRRARREPVTVVSGPPGTGKSHLVAALAIDEVRLGRSVLIAAQSEHAVDAVHELLDRHPGPRFVRFGSRRHREAVADALASGLATPATPGDYKRFRQRFEEAAREQTSAMERLSRGLERELAFQRSLATRDELAWVVGDVPALAELVDWDEVRELMRRSRHDGGSLPARWLRSRARRRLLRLLRADPALDDETIEYAIEYGLAEDTVRRTLRAGGASLETAFDRLDSASQVARSRLGDLIDAVPRRPASHGDDAMRAIASLASALRSGPTRRRQVLRELEGGNVLSLLPLWLGTLTDIDDSLPVAAGMFDVVIFDEASQINQIRSASALVRAKRAVVVGDPRQLRHVSFVSDAAMRQAVESRGLAGTTAMLADVRRNSLFDVAVGSADVVPLDEHFRSLPHIIGFADREFYSGSLRLMTQHPASESTDAIRLVRVDGTRGENGVNQSEVDAVRDIVAGALSRSDASVGVLSPFRAQADALEAMLLDGFSGDQIRHLGLRVGTVHSFQGNERDSVIISMALGPDQLGRSLRFVEDPNLFNVMVTRAKNEVVLVHSTDPARLPPGLFRRYLKHAGEPPLPFEGHNEAAGWIGGLARRLEAYGLRVVPNYPVAGHRVDLAVGDGSAAVGVECIVHPDGPRAHIERHMALRRAGWELVDAFESRWLAHPEAAVEAIVEEVLRRQTRPMAGSGQ